MKPYIYSKSALVETLTEKALQKQAAESMKKSTQNLQQVQLAQNAELQGNKAKIGVKKSISNEIKDASKNVRSKTPQSLECTAQSDISHNMCCRNRVFKSALIREKQAIQRYRSPFIYGFLQRNEVDVCVDRIKKYESRRR